MMGRCIRNGIVRLWSGCHWNGLLRRSLPAATLALTACLAFAGCGESNEKIKTPGTGALESGEDSEEISVRSMFPDQSWALPMENLGPLRGSPGITARDCSTCHASHYEEWSRSTHAHALSDLQFQSELSKPTSPEWLCLNCHIPVGNQRETIVRKVKGGDLLKPIHEKNPRFDPAMMEEGVTCATCHLRNVDGRTVVLGPLGTGRAPHPVVADRKALQNRCLDCHNVTYKVSSSLVCFFDTGNELAKSELSDRSCSSCHMPELERRIASVVGDFPERRSHFHYFIGGGIPKEFSLLPYQEKGGYRSGLDLSLVGYEWIPASGTLRFTIRMANKDTAHHLPTGDPERFILVKVIAYPTSEKAEKSYRIGQHWEWEPEARQIADNRLRSGEIRIWQDEMHLDEPPQRLRLEAVHVRLTEKNAEYMENTAARTNEKYRSRISRLRQHYPRQRIIHSEDILLGSPLD